MPSVNLFAQLICDGLNFVLSICSPWISAGVTRWRTARRKQLFLAPLQQVVGVRLLAHSTFEIDELELYTRRTERDVAEYAN